MRILLLLMCVLGLSAAEPFSLEQLTAATKDISSLSVTFVQEKHLAILDEPVVSPGLIEIDRKREAVRWEFTGKSVLLFIDGKLRRFGAEGKEETVTVKDQGVNSMVSQMKAFLHGDWSGMRDMFTITPAADGQPQPRERRMGRRAAQARVRGLATRRLRFGADGVRRRSALEAVERRRERRSHRS